MSVNTTPKDTIDRMKSMALIGDLNTASAALNQSALNKDQTAKVASILNEPRSEIEQAIVAAVGEGNTASQSLQTSHPIANELYPDIMGNLFYHLSQCDYKTLREVACVNKHWNACSTNFWVGSDLERLCPELTILDAKSQGVKCEDEPKINKRQLLKWVREISPHVEGNAGVTLLTMTKGTTLKQLIEIAKGEGMAINVLWNRIIEELGDVPVEKTYGVLITNSVFLNSRNKHFNSQKTLVEGHGCKPPTVQEDVALCVFTNKVLKKCVYGKNPCTYGRSSTHVGNIPLAVGGSTPAHLGVCSSRYNSQSSGAGGQRTF